MLLCKVLSGEQVHDVGPYLSRKANKPLVLQRELNGNSRGHRSCVKSAARPVLGYSWPQCVSVVFFFAAHLMWLTCFKCSAVACSPARPPRQYVHLEVFKSSAPFHVLTFALCNNLVTTSFCSLSFWTKFMLSGVIQWLPTLNMHPISWRPWCCKKTDEHLLEEKG